MKYALIALALCFVTTSAEAAIVDITYSGLATGADGAGFFGVAGASYTNTPFSTHFTFDEANSGSAGGTLNVDITINAQNLSLFGGGGFQYTGDLVVPAYSRRTSYVNFGGSTVANGFFWLSTTLVSDSTPTDRTTPYSTTGSKDPAAGANIWDQFGYEGYGPMTGIGTFFTLRATALDVLSTPGTPSGCCAPGLGATAIPEPNSWTLMLSGFGLAGAALRRRHARVS